MTDITKEEAMAAIATLQDAAIYRAALHTDVTATLITLARAGAAVMFASEETVEKAGFAISRAYEKYVISKSRAEFAEEVRAALAALSTPPPEA